jgi:hypothetical protein
MKFLLARVSFVYAFPAAVEVPSAFSVSKVPDVHCCCLRPCCCWLPCCCYLPAVVIFPAVDDVPDIAGNPVVAVALLLL